MRKVRRINAACVDIDCLLHDRCMLCMFISEQDIEGN